jgi:hypothetical protein
MLFRETICAYCENHMKHTITLCEENLRVYVCYKQLVTASVV